MEVFLIITIFHFPQFFSSPFIITTSLIFIFIGFLRLCLSLRVTKYLRTHRFQAASFYLCTYHCPFFQLSPTYSSSRESSGNLISLPRIIEFGVNTEYSKSSSIYVNGRLFKLTSTSNNISSNSNHVNNDLPMDLYRFCFVSPIKRSYCPPHHGALERLNFR